jgi:hypothetical protein
MAKTTSGITVGDRVDGRNGPVGTVDGNPLVSGGSHSRSGARLRRRLHWARRKRARRRLAADSARRVPGVLGGLDHTVAGEAAVPAIA